MRSWRTSTTTTSCAPRRRSSVAASTSGLSGLIALAGRGSRLEDPRQRTAVEPREEILDHAGAEFREHRVVHEAQVRRQHDVLATGEGMACRERLIVVDIESRDARAALL